MGKPLDSTDHTDESTILTTYGLLSIASQVRASGRNVLICNLSTFTWDQVEKLIQAVDIDLVGITCMTFNVRGAAALSALIRALHLKANIVTAPTLRRCPMRC